MKMRDKERNPLRTINRTHTSDLSKISQLIDSQ